MRKSGVWDYRVEAWYLTRPDVQAFGTVHNGYSSAYAEFLAAHMRSDIGRIVVRHESGRVVSPVSPIEPEWARDKA